MSHTSVTVCTALLVVACVPPSSAPAGGGYPAQSYPTQAQGNQGLDDESDGSDGTDYDQQTAGPWAAPQQGYPQQAQPQQQSNPQASGPSVRSDDCRVQVIPPDIKGGCPVRLVTPAPCETIDLSAGQRYEFAWTTDGVKCETPWTVQAAGNPIQAGNYLSVQYSTNVEQGISSTGGVLYVSAADVAQLTSDNGLFHWQVSSYYGSRTGTTTFRIRR